MTTHPLTPLECRLTLALKLVLDWLQQAERELNKPLPLGYAANMHKARVIARMAEALADADAVTSCAWGPPPYVLDIMPPHAVAALPAPCLAAPSEVMP